MVCKCIYVNESAHAPTQFRISKAPLVSRMIAESLAIFFILNNCLHNGNTIKWVTNTCFHLEKTPLH